MRVGNFQWIINTFLYLITLGSPKLDPTMPQKRINAERQSLWREERAPRTGLSASMAEITMDMMVNPQDFHTNNGIMSSGSFETSPLLILNKKIKYF